MKISGLIDNTCRLHANAGDSVVINLPDFEPKPFELFCLFTYTRNIVTTEQADAPESTVDREWLLLVQAWALGDHLYATDFKDAVIDAIIDKLNNDRVAKPPTLHRIIYCNANPDTLLRQLAVDIAAWRWDNTFLANQKIAGGWRGWDVCTDFFVDLALSLNKAKKTGQSGEPPFEGDTCTYHEHRLVETPCYKTKPMF